MSSRILRGGAAGLCRTGMVAVVLWAIPATPATAQAPGTEAARRATLERMIRDIREDYPDVPTITPSGLRESLAAGGIVLVDVRTERERNVSTLPGAISADEFESRLEDLAGRTVVAYCTIGVRSSGYVREMRRRGVEVLNLEGSVLAWTHIGGQLVLDGVATDRLHVYGRRWNLAADGYRTTW
ncbi:MAG: rhodanese-like domain-containing protein [Gemmatimonadetes bacterium]|nr:rhodanese-like domain-containing protein [Gemmatimonadota bacterium]